MVANLETILIGAKKDVPLKDYTTYKIGGPAKYFFIAETVENLVKALKIAKEFKTPIFILGGGSNLLISDNGFDGLVIKMNIMGVGWSGDKLTVGSGEKLAKLAYMLADKGFSGLEWAAGIPGAAVGGSIYGNAQAFGTKISDFLESVRAVDLKTLEIKNFTKNQCHFSLKDSIFKENKNLIVVSACFIFPKADSEFVKEKITEFLNYRKNKHPIQFPSLGSAFVNPEVKIKDKKLLKKFPELENFNKTGIIPCGYLIAKSGLSGRQIGQAQISEKHSNFIVNLGEAKAEDVIALMKLAQSKVKEVFGILLEPEVRFVGFSESDILK